MSVGGGLIGWVGALLVVVMSGAPKEQTPVPGASRLTASATGLFVRIDGGVRRIATVRIEGPAARAGGRLRIGIGGRSVEHAIEATTRGDRTLQTAFPPIEGEGVAKVSLVSGDRALTTTMTVPRTKRWTVYVAPTVHTDIGYTHHQSEIPEIHNANTDRMIALCDRFPDYRGRLECSWSAQMYERHRGPERMAKLAALARRGRIGIEGTYVNMLTGLCSAEELVRWLYPSADLLRRYGVPFETATQNDVPSFVGSLPTILRRAGIKYLTVGVNNNQTRGPILRGGIHMKSPFWWRGPDGSRVLTWYAGRYVQARDTGLTENLVAAEKKLTAWLAGWDRRDDYPYDAVMIHGAYGDNRDVGTALAETVAAWNAKYAYPKIVMTGLGEFFEHVEKRFADKIPTIRGSGGVYWEDGAGSSARQTAINRRTHHRIVAAEAVLAGMSSLAPNRPYPRERIAKTWENVLLYDEHTWGARRWGRDPEHEQVVKQWATKSAFATDAERDSKTLLNEGLAWLAGSVAGKGKGVLVFNPLSWSRTDVVRVALPRGSTVVDADGRKVPAQTVSLDERAREVLLLAEDVPPVGYRRYDLVNGPAEGSSTGEANSEPRALENRFYRVVLDGKSGAIASITDKQTGAELVDAASPYKLGEVIYAAGGAGTEAIAWKKKLPPAEFEFSRSNGATWRTTARGPLATVATSSTKTRMFPHVGLAVTLYDHARRIDLTVHLDKTLTYEMEGVYVAFPFAADRPRFEFDVGGGWVRPNDDHLPGACFDWFCVQQCVTLDTGRGGVNLSPIDTPLISLCQINTGKWMRKLDVTNGTVFAYVMNNYWPTNYKPGQGGKYAFRYSITSDVKMSKTAAAHHGWGGVQPLAATLVGRAPETATLPPAGSFCRINAPNVVLTALKRAEDGDGLILRFMEIAGKPTRLEVVCDLLPKPKAAWRCDAVERKLSNLQISQGKPLVIDVDAFGIETVRLMR